MRITIFHGWLRLFEEDFAYRSLFEGGDRLVRWFIEENQERVAARRAELAR